MGRADLTLSAGPNDVSSGVKAALGAPIAYHYDPAFKERFRATEEKIGRIYGSPSHEIILMQGEAILGLEAAARGLVAARHEVPQSRLGRLRQGLRLLAQRHRRGAPRDRGALRRRGRSRGGRRLPDRAPGHHGRVGRPLRDALGDPQPGLRHRADRAPPWCGHHRRRRLLVRRDRAAPRGVAARPHRGRAPEVPRRPSWHVAAGRERVRLGRHRRQPGRPTRFVPLDHGLARQVARRGPLPVHAVGVGPARRRRGGRRAARRRPRRLDRPAPARVRGLLDGRGGDGPAALAGQEVDRVGLRVRDPCPGRAHRHRGARSRPRALRGPVLGGPGCRQHHPHRAHGRDGSPDAHDRRPGCARAHARRPGRTSRCRCRPGCRAGAALGERRVPARSPSWSGPAPGRDEARPVRDPSRGLDRGGDRAHRGAR